MQASGVVSSVLSVYKDHLAKLECLDICNRFIADNLHRCGDGLFQYLVWMTQIWF